MKIMEKLSTYAALIGVIGAIGGGFYTWGQFNSRLDAIEKKPVINLTSLKQDVFPKAFQSFDAMAKGLTHTKSSAEAGVPFDEEGSMVLINNAIKTEQDILSSIHDEESPLYQFLNDFAEQYPKANTDFAHIDSPNYSKSDLGPLVKNYALQKLRAQYRLHSKANSNSKLTAEQIIKKFS